LRKRALAAALQATLQLAGCCTVQSDGNGLAPAARRCLDPSFNVAIDIGHSTSHPGVSSARGVSELTFNRDLARALVSDMQRRGLAATLINADGEIDSLAQRTALAAAAGADLFVSIHHDSVQPHYLSTWMYAGRRQLFSDRFAGFSIFVSRKNPHADHSVKVAQAVGQHLLGAHLTPTLHHAEKIPGENRELIDAVRGIYRFDELIVLKTAAMPAVLVELGVIVNRTEEEILATESFRATAAAAISAALLEVCSSRAGGATPPASGAD